MQAEINNIFDNIEIVLVETTHPGNIGAAARAMKAMGLKHLRLVNPRTFPGAEATARAAGADDILESAACHGSLREAIADCSLVYGTSNRNRNIPWPLMDAETSAQAVIRAVGEGVRAAILFGTESSGLSNDDLELCHGLIRIPVNGEFPSLNIAAAVQVICYELRKTILKGKPDGEPVNAGSPPVNSEQMVQLYEHMQECLRDLEFYNPERPRLLMRRLKRIFNRLYLDENEYNIIRGILAAAQEAAKKKYNA